MFGEIAAHQERVQITNSNVREISKVFRKNLGFFLFLSRVFRIFQTLTRTLFQIIQNFTWYTEHIGDFRRYNLCDLGLNCVLGQSSKHAQEEAQRKSRRQLV